MNSDRVSRFNSDYTILYTAVFPVSNSCFGQGPVKRSASVGQWRLIDRREQFRWSIAVGRCIKKIFTRLAMAIRLIYFRLARRDPGTTTTIR